MSTPHPIGNRHSGNHALFQKDIHNPHLSADIERHMSVVNDAVIPSLLFGHYPVYNYHNCLRVFPLLIDVAYHFQCSVVPLPDHSLA